MIRLALDRLAATHTCYPTLAELVAASRSGYLPTIRQPSLACAVRALGGRCWSA